MRQQPVSLFPFLGVLLSTMGVLSFLAVTFSLFSQASPEASAPEQPVEVQWVGAPPHVRPVLVECLEDELVLHHRVGQEYQLFSREALQAEVEAVRELMAQAIEQFGAGVSRSQQWLYVKTQLERQDMLQNSLTRALHELEMQNMGNAEGVRTIQRYPILLIYPDGIGTYDLASYLVESTTRLSMGLEPMREGWSLPYRDHAL